MTLLKLLATALVALFFVIIALPGYAANDSDGVTNGGPITHDHAARPRRHHRHHKHQRHGQRHHRRQHNPSQGAPAGRTDRG